MFRSVQGREGHVYNDTRHEHHDRRPAGTGDAVHQGSLASLGIGRADCHFCTEYGLQFPGRDRSEDRQCDRRRT